MENIEQIIQQIKDGNVEPFRNNFQLLSFDEVSIVYQKITPHFGEQRHYSLGQVKAAGKAIGLSGTIVELGSHDGKLAELMLQEFLDIEEWTGYDVCEVASISKAPKYKHIILKDWFHRCASLDGVDCFVSTHTLEHMDWDLVEDTLSFVAKSEVSKILLEIPFRPSGNWRGSRSAHILKAHPHEIKDLLQQYKFKMKYYRKSGMNYIWGFVR